MQIVCSKPYFLWIKILLVLFALWFDVHSNFNTLCYCYFLIHIVLAMLNYCTFKHQRQRDIQHLIWPKVSLGGLSSWLGFRLFSVSFSSHIASFIMLIIMAISGFITRWNTRTIAFLNTLQPVCVHHPFPLSNVK